MRVFTTFEEIEAATGEEIGTTDWVEITQERVNQFADATGDHQWIHVDEEKAKAGPFGGTIAHGYLSLSLLPELLGQLLKVTDARMAINYGTEKVRFTSPVPVGSRVRAAARLEAAERRGEGILYRVAVRIEIDGAEKPALVGDVLYLVF